MKPQIKQKTAFSTSQRIGLIIFMLFTSQIALAEVFHWPKICETQTLQIENKSDIDFTMWLQKWNLTLEDEVPLNVNAQQKISLELNNDLENFSQNYSLLHLDPTLKETLNFSISIFCHDENKTLIKHSSLEGGLITFKLQDLTTYNLQLTNLTPDENKVTLEELNIFLDDPHPFTQTFIIKPRSSVIIPYKNTKVLSRIRVSAEGRFTAFAFRGEKEQIYPYSIKIQPSQIEKVGSYFLVTHRENSGDSFVVHITDSNMIEKARDQIKNPALEKIVFAEVTLGHKGFNRNFSTAIKSFWSWSTTRVTNISDLGSINCNGFPQMVEDRAEFWTEYTQKICFWSYRIKKELKYEDVSQNY